MNELAVRPFLKWAGGKRALLPEILPRIPKFSGRYIEPFLGAGAVMFAMPANVPKILNDFNVDLIEVYESIRDFPDQLAIELKRHKNTKEHFMSVRSWDRREDFGLRDPVERAARFIYLNRTCFNGLYRVNSKGEFNVPYGNYAKPDLALRKTIIDASNFLNALDSAGRQLVQLSSGDYRNATSKASAEDFVYLDPPYDPVSATSSFVSYQQGGFGRDDQALLRDEVLRLTSLNVPVLLSNSDTPFIRGLFEDKDIFQIASVSVSRAIGASPSSRGKVGEVLVSNFGALS